MLSGPIRSIPGNGLGGVVVYGRGGFGLLDQMELLNGVDHRLPVPRMEEVTWVGDPVLVGHVGTESVAG